jgi:uncharacterized membrane protein
MFRLFSNEPTAKRIRLTLLSWLIPVLRCDATSFHSGTFVTEWTMNGLIRPAYTLLLNSIAISRTFPRPDLLTIVLTLVLLLSYKAHAFELREFFGFDVVGIADDGSFALQGTGKTTPELATPIDFTEDGELRSWLAFLSRRDGTMVRLQPGTGYARSRVTAMSRSGQFVTGISSIDSGPPQVTVWDSDGASQLKEKPGGAPGWGAAVSNDGAVVGYESSLEDRLFNRPWRWSSDGHAELLPILPGFEVGAAFDVSRDGIVIVGESHSNSDQKWEATLWTDDGTNAFAPISLGRFREQNTLARKVSADGTVVVGDYFGDGLFVIPNGQFRWTESNGFEPLGQLHGAEWTSVSAINSDASIVVGVAQPDREQSFVWDEQHGMRDLKTVLIEEHGLSPNAFPDGHFRVDEISPDGSILGGYAGDAWPYATGWVLYLDRPLVVTTVVVGDFNGNAELEVEDLDLLAKELRSARNVDLFDVNSDGVVNFEDRRLWISSLANTSFGDANLDGEFNSRDLVSILAAGEYEDEMELNSTWSTGDWNGDGEFSSSDLVLAFDDGGYERGPRRAIQVVPEPAAAMLSPVACICVAFCTRRRQCNSRRREIT